MTWRKAKHLEFVGEEPLGENSPSAPQPSRAQIEEIRQRMRDAPAVDLDLHMGGEEQSRRGQALLEADQRLQQRLVRRYANRKLFDTQARRYLTLKELAGLVRSGEKIKVVDVDGTTDLTAATLAEIIRQEKNEPSVKFVPASGVERPSSRISIDKELEPPPTLNLQ
jgi:hypothetical protein